MITSTDTLLERPPTSPFVPQLPLRESPPPSSSKCRACFKRCVAQLLRTEAEGDAQRAQAKRRDAQAALEAAASAARSVSVDSLAESTPDAADSAAAAVAASPPPLIDATATAAAASNSPPVFATAVGASPAKRHRDHSGGGESSAAVGEQKDGRRSRSPSRAPKRLATKSAMNNDQSHHQSHFSFN